MRLKKDGGFKIYFLFQFLSVLFAVAMIFFFVYVPVPYSNFIASLLSSESILLPFRIIIGIVGILGGGVLGLLLGLCAIAVLIETFNFNETDTYYKVEVKPTKKYIITQEEDDMILYFKKWWGTYYKWKKVPKNYDVAQLSIEYDAFFEEQTVVKKKEEPNIIYRKR